MKKKTRLFGDMAFGEVEKWERETNSLVLFDDASSTIGIAFQKSKSDEPALVIQIDGLKRPVVLFEDQIDDLMNYLKENF
jgi:hypothetical protein